MASELTLRERLLGTAPKKPIMEFLKESGEEARTAGRGLRDSLLGVDPNFDPSGVQDFSFRAGLSRADNEKERRSYLNKTVGPEGWTQNSFGAYALTDRGMAKLNLESKGKPVLIDEPITEGPTMGDIADISGEAGPIMGAVGAGMAATGLGFGPGIALTALGGMAGKSIQEAGEELAGENLQTPLEIGKDVLMEGPYAALGEGIFRGILKPIGKKLMAPEAKRMTREKRVLAKIAGKMGAQASVSQIQRIAQQGGYERVSRLSAVP